MKSHTEEKIEQAYSVAVKLGLNPSSEAKKDLFMMSLRRIAVAAVDEVRNEVSQYMYVKSQEYSEGKQKKGGRNNRLIDNCQREHLPPIEKTELFLLKCKEAFDNPNKFFGGMFDWVMSESGCSSK
jgi:hypothetical protein